MKTLDFGWLIGLIEGEGSIHLNKNSPVLTLSMIDKDVIKRAARLMGKKIHIRHYGPYKSNCLSKQIQYRFNVCGSDCIEFIKKIYPHMGKRRKEQIRLVLTKWDERQRIKQVLSRRQFLRNISVTPLYQFI